MYSESGLIDEITLRLHLINELKRFGGNVMDIYPKILEVKNSQARLPENFFSLYKAVKTEPIGYYSDCEDDTALISSTFFRIRKEASTEWNNQSHQFEPGCYTEVSEEVYLADSRLKAEFYYGNHKSLKLVEGFDRSNLSLECENIRVLKSPYHINIINNTLQTNFSTGFVCIWYQGLRLDDETDEIVLPEDPNARLYEFLMYSGKAKIFEQLWANSDDPNVQGKLQYFSQQRELARTSASAQARFSSVTGNGWWDNLKRKQKRKTNIFENYGR